MMKRLLLLLPAALLLTPSCSSNCNTPCRKTAPTRCCPQPATKRCCPGASAHGNRTLQHVLKTSPKRGMVTLNNLMDYLPCQPPGYTTL